MELVNHIRDLLYHHDCVVVPGFGGFVTNERSARIDRAAGSFFPPAREVGFNARLDHNDGLLISYLSAKLAINYVDARKLVESFAEDVAQKFSEGRVVHFEGIGQFSVDREGKLQFDPDPAANFLTDSYGLSFFRYPELEAAEPVRRMQKSMREPGTAGFSQKTRKLLRYAAVGIPLIAALTWGAMNTDLVREFSFNLTSLNPFTAVVDTGINPGQSPAGSPVRSDTAVSVAIEELSNQRQALSYEEPVAMPDPLPPAAAVSVPVEVSGPVPSESVAGAVRILPEPGPAGRHHVVAGSFRSMENAQLLRDELASEGYNSRVLEPERGIYRVSLYSTDSSGEAHVMLGQVRMMAARTDAWILTR